MYFDNFNSRNANLVNIIFAHDNIVVTVTVIVNVK